MLEFLYVVNGKHKLPQNSLVVCAGSLVHRTAAEMPAGFGLFKLIMDETSAEYKDICETIDEQFSRYHSNEDSMPDFEIYGVKHAFNMQIGLATVPNLDSRKGLKNSTYDKNQYIEEYKAVIRAVLIKFKKLKESDHTINKLAIQPLGISAGWTPEEAASLTAQVLNEPEFAEIDIAIPIYDTALGSNDMIYKSFLLREMIAFGRIDPSHISVRTRLLDMLNILITCSNNATVLHNLVNFRNALAVDANPNLSLWLDGINTIFHQTKNLPQFFAPAPQASIQDSIKMFNDCVALYKLAPLMPTPTSVRGF